MEVITVSLLVLPLVSSHGNMFHPPVWQDRTPSEHWHHQGCGVLDLPEDNEFFQSKGKQPDCLPYWYIDGVKIPGEATIPDDMSQSEVTCTGQQGHHHDEHHKNPWHAPGTAPLFGACGTLGGWPLGCDGDGRGKFGDCCSGNCDGFALGDNAENYDWDSIDGGPIVTEWFAGSNQEVRWYVSANHAGGYSYRLCKMPHGGISHVTEECFQDLQLDFHGDKQWVVYQGDHSSGKRTEIHAKRTSHGTFPHGSQWTANPFWPMQEEGGDQAHGQGEVIDEVHVPSSIQPGEYVLSFRWDCKCTPQVWASCATVTII